MKYLITLFMCSIGWSLAAQQELQYTQFMYNKLSFNPAYAGSEDAPCLTAIYRNQWIGLEGSPQSQTISFNAPVLSKRVGLGFNLSRSTIGIGSRVTLEGTYVYRISMGPGRLGVGILASMRYISMNYSDERLFAAQPIMTDGGIPVGNLDRYVPNFGAGIYYNTKEFYVGLAAPRMLRSNIDFNDLQQILGREFPHIYAMGGYRFQLKEKIDLQSQVLVKFVEHAPLDVDLNLSFYFSKKVMTGITYRTGGSSHSFGESIDFLAGLQIKPQVFFGLAYDMTLSELRTYNNGSVEALLRLCFASPEGDTIVNPRFF